MREPRPGGAWTKAAAVCGLLALLGPVGSVLGLVWYLNAYPPSEDEGTVDAWGEFFIVVWGMTWMVVWILAAVGCCIGLGIASSVARRRPPVVEHSIW